MYESPERSRPKSRESAKKAKRRISIYYSTGEGLRTPKSEGKNCNYADRFDEGRQVEGAKLELLRGHFDSICETLSSDLPEHRIRYIRKTEMPATLQDLIDFGSKLDREVGIFLDKEFMKEPRKPSYKNTPFVLYAGDKESGNGATIGASIKFPMNNSTRFRIIAHFHPTKYDDKIQLTGDINKADKDVEIVVNGAGSIFYYNETGCFNARSLISRGWIYKGNDLKPEFDHNCKFDLQTPIDIRNIAYKLDRITGPKKTIPVYLENGYLSISHKCTNRQLHNRLIYHGFFAQNKKARSSSYKLACTSDTRKEYREALSKLSLL